MTAGDLIVFGIGGAIVLMVLGNYSRCTAIANDASTYVVGPNGQNLGPFTVATSYGSVSQMPPQCNKTTFVCKLVTPTNQRPGLNCLLNPFPGGL